jgi:hypothetical protein
VQEVSHLINPRLSGKCPGLIGIAVNNDPGSPLFEQVDYGIVDDCREFVPLLLKKIKEHLEKRITC